MNKVRWWTVAAGVAVLAVLAGMPAWVSVYRLSLLISVLTYVALASAWSFFSGTTRYTSLATAAFFGSGAYVMAVLGEVVPFPVVIAAAFGVGLLLALVTGLATLRISGMYFVIFTFGLTELVRQVTLWYEANVTGTVGRFIFVFVSQEQIYYYLLGICVFVLAGKYLVFRSRFGYALRAIGEDEVAANHLGINLTATKLFAFAATGAVMAAVGAVLAPRWTYIDPHIVFNPMISFQVVIMALLGGVHRLYGPLLGAIPVVLLFEALAVQFPYHFMIIIGLGFILTVYYLPDGLVGLWENVARKFAHKGSTETPQSPPAGGTT